MSSKIQIRIVLVSFMFILSIAAVEAIAEVLLPVIYYNDTAYFSGIKLNEALPELVLIFPGNSSIIVKNATEIPQAFYSIR